MGISIRRNALKRVLGAVGAGLGLAAFSRVPTVGAQSPPASIVNDGGSVAVAADGSVTATLPAGKEYTIGSSGMQNNGHLVVSGNMPGSDVAIVSNNPLYAQPTTNDQVGLYIREYGQINSFGASRVVIGGVVQCQPSFGFSTPQAGDLVALEAMASTQGGVSGGDFNGTIRGLYAHADVSGNGNGISINEMYGAVLDIGFFSQGSNYVVDSAVTLKVSQPSATNIGTITQAYAAFIAGTLAVGTAVGTDNFKVGTDGKVTFASGTATASSGAATLNKPSGTITTESLSTGAGNKYTLTLTNSFVASTSRVFVSGCNGTNSAPNSEITVQKVTPGSGSVVIVVKNTGSQAYNGSLKLSFAVLA